MIACCSQMFMGVLDMINRAAANSLVSTLPCKEIRMKMEEAKNEIAESETQPAEIKQEHQPVPSTPPAAEVS